MNPFYIITFFFIILILPLHAIEQQEKSYNLFNEGLSSPTTSNTDLSFLALGKNYPGKASVAKFDLPSNQYYFIADDLASFVLNPMKLISYENAFAWAIPVLLYAYDQPLYNFYSREVEPRARYLPLKFNDDFIFKSMQIVHIINGNLNNDEIRTLNYALGEAIVDAYFVSQATKHVFGRARPPAGLGPYSWFNFSLDPEGPYTSFFSTHATVYFSAATVLGKYLKNDLLGDLIGVMAYFSLEHHNHWLSDMLVGYLVGKCIGNYVWEKCSNRDLRDSWWIYPTFIPGEGEFYPAIGAWKFF